MSQPGKAPVQAPKYQHDALPDGQSIRMLNLYAGALDDPLEGELEVLDIASCGNYETLSYVWGEPERCHDIICNGKCIGLTASLHDALRRLRQLDRHRLLWADQICRSLFVIPSHSLARLGLKSTGHGLDSPKRVSARRLKA